MNFQVANRKPNPFDAPKTQANRIATETNLEANPTRLVVLCIFGALIAVLIGWITNLSYQFELSLPVKERPILTVVACFAAAFWLYIAAIIVARKIPDSISLSATIIGFALLLRALMFVSTPIQEVDIYRYIWDGIVLSEGVSPFKYPPEQIRLTPIQNTLHDPELRKLVARYRQGHGTAEALNLVHFAQVPTVYPPVSQAVFGAAAITTPTDASLLTRLRVMKLWLLLFDLGTVLLLISLLKSLQLPTALSIGYAWCPLVLKEIGNSGHLDSIAIFLTTCAVVLFVRGVLLKTSSPMMDAKPTKNNATLEQSDSPHSKISNENRFSLLGTMLPVLFLALAIGAKIYAVVLVPLFLLVAIKRLGWQATIIPALAFIGLTTLVCWPMLPDSITKRIADSSGPAAKAEQEKETGLSIFFKYWEMNDFLFMNTVENLKPASLESRKDAWFSVIPNQPREQISEYVVDNFLTSDEHNTPQQAQIERQNARAIAPFLTTRFILTLVFFIVAVALAIWASKRNHSQAFCRAAFLTLAWFWLLAPTQNPWYWLWALPLIPFAKNRTWYLMSGLLFIYYLRFWFEYHFTGVNVADSLNQWVSFELPQWAGGISHYQGVDFFDFVVTWLEHLPWYLLLSIETLWCLLLNSTPAIADETAV